MDDGPDGDRLAFMLEQLDGQNPEDAMERVKKFSAAFLVALLAGSLSSANAQSAKTTLRVADYLPVSHHFSKNGAKTWMERVTARTNGAVVFEYFPSEQLGKAKDLLSLTLSGVADVGLVAPSYVSEKMPLSSVAELPGGFPTSCDGTLAYWKLATNGLLANHDFAPNGVRLLVTFVNPPYQILAKQPIQSASSFAGLKLRSTGGAMDIMVRKLGAVPVRMAGPDVFEALSRGTLDGIVFPLAAVLVYDLQGLTRYSTQDENFGSTVLNYVISEERWKKLPPDVQRIMIEEGEAATRHNCAMVDADQKAAIEKLKKAGVTMVALPENARKELNGTMATVANEWASDLDRRGKRGGEALKAFRSALGK